MSSEEQPSEGLRYNEGLVDTSPPQFLKITNLPLFLNYLKYSNTDRLIRAVNAWLIHSTITFNLSRGRGPVYEQYDEEDRLNRNLSHTRLKRVVEDDKMWAEFATSLKHEQISTDDFKMMIEYSIREGFISPPQSQCPEKDIEYQQLIHQLKAKQSKVCTIM
jgi:hypothetical protein